MSEETKTTKPNIEDSQKLAMVIECIKAYIPMLDIEYAKAAVKAMHDQASRQDTLSVLAAHYDNKRSEHLHAQAHSLEHLVKFVEGMIECNKLKEQIEKNNEHFDNIDKLFL